jgi:hypothetical protein
MKIMRSNFMCYNFIKSWFDTMIFGNKRQYISMSGNEEQDNSIAGNNEQDNNIFGKIDQLHH